MKNVEKLVIGLVLLLGVSANGSLILQAEWDDGSFDADVNTGGGTLQTWPSGYVANVNMQPAGIGGRWAVDATHGDAFLRYYIANQANAGTYVALVKLDGWDLGENNGNYLGGLNNYGATAGISVRNQNTYVRAFESTGGSPYIQPGGLILPGSEWIFMAYAYDSATARSRLYLLDAFTGAGYSSAEASGYAADPFDLLTVGNAGAPGGGIQPGGSIHGWVDGVRLYNTAMTLDQIQTVRGEMVPEPATIGLVALGLLGLLRKRRQTRSA